MPKQNATPETERPEHVLDPEACWAAVSQSDSTADGAFVYAVTTTGVYCRPSCGARTPRQENAAFFVSAADAEAAGFRACKRCRPDGASQADRDAEAVREVCRQIEQRGEGWFLEELAAGSDMSAAHLRAAFKSLTGLTPKQYALQVRNDRAKVDLRRAPSVTDAIYASGYGSSGRFYEDADRSLGMRPTQYRNGGLGAEICYAVGESSLGSVLVAQTERGVCAILFGEDEIGLAEDLRRRFPNAEVARDDADLRATVRAVLELVDDPCLGIGLPLDIRGTAFQRRVWSALRDIPPGQTVTYTDIAEKVGSPKAARAVAGACAANSLAVAVPCHRVVRGSGDLAGYRWGVERKRELLEREAACARAASESPWAIAPSTADDGR